MPGTSATEVDPELQPLISARSTPNLPPTPLLPSDRQYLTTREYGEDFVACHIYKIHGSESGVWHLRRTLQHWLASKWGHYFVISLVAVDICCIFANFLVSLHICEHGRDRRFDLHRWQMARGVLDCVALIFSSLFMAELVGSVFAFGFRYFFTSPFHTFDALVIIFAFIIDLVLRAGPLEEAGSLVIVLRLWRVFKIIEEFSTGAEAEMSGMQERIDDLIKQKEEVMKQNEELKMRLGESGEDGREHADGYMDGHVNGNGIMADGAAG